MIRWRGRPRPCPPTSALHINLSIQAKMVIPAASPRNESATIGQPGGWYTSGPYAKLGKSALLQQPKVILHPYRKKGTPPKQVVSHFVCNMLFF